MYRIAKNLISVNKNYQKLAGSRVEYKTTFLHFSDHVNSLYNITLEQKYDPEKIEKRWYDFWEENNYFKPFKSDIESFVILFPPPNITGTLHLGHTLTTTVQDVIMRWKRMKGESVMWIPGIDHAGIAAQVAVEKYLKKKFNLTRNELGKEEFLKKMLEWKEDKEILICQQLKSMGASLDWSKVKFTMDAAHSDLVTKSFINLFEKGLIYRKEALVNWSCAIKTSISDIEINWIDIDKRTKINVPGYNKPIDFGLMYKIAYKICDEDTEIIVDTTRPETMLGDVAIAVHSADSRYTKFINKMAWHPFRNEKIPIIADDIVDPTFGSGAVKITPSHSTNDHLVASKHKLKVVNVINEDGRIDNVGVCNKFFGLKRFDARHVIVNELKNLELFRGLYNHSMKVPVCSRSGDIIEYILKSQWFLNCNELAADALNLVDNNILKMSPDNYKTIWRDWLSNIKDWNLSRQLWWGHQIPMYHCKTNENEFWVPALNLQEAKIKASKRLQTPSDDIQITRDPDVLDTWFSSALLPLNISSSLNPFDLKRIPISMMVTGFDILFFWVARMVMLNRCLTGVLPFNEIFLHGLICDSQGAKMSKSVGNVIQPDYILKGCSLDDLKNDLKNNFDAKLITSKNFQSAIKKQENSFPNGIPQCGADALRFSLCINDIQEAAVNFDFNICYGNRVFCNKIWQSMNYFIKFVNDCNITAEDNFEEFKSGKNYTIFDKWIISQLAGVINIVDSSLNENRFSVATREIKNFFINDFCGVYLESTKLTTRENSNECKNIISVMYDCLENGFKLLSPFMPFVTEHLYQAMPRLKGFDKSKSIMISKFPCPKDWASHHDQKLEKQIKSILHLLSTVRKLLDLYKLTKKNPNVFIKSTNDFDELLFGDANQIFAKLGRVNCLKKVESHDGTDVIEEEIQDGCVAFVEHKLDRETLLKSLTSVLNKENKLIENLKKLRDEGIENNTKTKRMQHKNTLESISGELKKIEQIKKVIANCSK